MKRILQIVLISLLFTSNVKAFEINSKNAILINLNDDTVLYEKNSKENTKIASLTKIMTAVVVLDTIDDLDKKVTITYEDFKGLAEEHAAVAGFTVDQTVSYRDLLYGLLLPSGADAAQAITRNISDSKEAFVELMNKKAKELGMKNTHFVNETGLDKDGQTSTVEDISILFKYALKNEEFSKIIKSSSYTTSDQKLTFKSTIKSKSKNLDMSYLLGGKTGTTYDAGLCLASIANYNNVDYMLITTNATYPSDTPLNFLDAKTVYEYYMKNYSYKTLVKKGDKLITIKTKNSTKDEITFKSNKEITKYLDKTFKIEDVKLEYSGLKELSYKNKVGEKIGKIKVIYKNETVDTIDIILNEKIKFNLQKYLMNHLLLIIGILLILGLLIIVLLVKITKK